MRLAAAAQLGFYPIPPIVMGRICKAISVTDPLKTMIIDPCCGEGAALKQLADSLGVPYDNCYGIELDHGRITKSLEVMPGLNVPSSDSASVACSAMSVELTYNQASILYLNPPFDDQPGGGGRMEGNFLSTYLHALDPDGGILIFVLPEHAAFRENNRIINMMRSNFEFTRIFKFPESYRKYNEIVMIGKRMRSKYAPNPDDETTIDQWGSNPRSALPINADLDFLEDEYVAPISKMLLRGPAKLKRFKKKNYTDQELFDAVIKSPIQKILSAEPEVPVLRPPLPLQDGHTSLILVAGVLNGVVQFEGEPPHVVRGTASKTKEPSQDTVDDGIRTTLFTDQIKTVVRLVWPNGHIMTLQ